jgi:NAD(P)H-quinone oxidoreductase subunit 5
VGLFPMASYWAMLDGISKFWIEAPWAVAVILLVNGLTAISLVRVFRLVFLGDATPKTKRSPEVPWQMSLPMGVLVSSTAMLPFVLLRLDLLPVAGEINFTAAAVLTISGIVGVTIGSLIQLSRGWLRPIQAPLRFVQDLLAYDFYIDKFYMITVVWAVRTLSSFTSWFDRYVVDGAVNLVGFASLFGGESLKYSESGKSQAYVLTILLGVGFIGLFLSWSKLILPGI